MDKSQVKISLASIEKELSYVHSGFECLLIINGKVDIEIDGQRSSLNTDDILVINSNTFYSIYGKRGNVVLKLKVGKQYLEKECREILKYDIECNSSKADKNEEFKYFEIKRMLTQMLIVYLEKKDGYRLQFKAIFFKFIHTLFKNFKADKNTIVEREKEESTNIILDTVSYINKNYQKPLSLKSISEEIHMSIQYFSKLFKKEMGIGYLEYLTEVRLDHAVSDLIYSNESILNIAMKNGFPNANSFRSAFKKKYKKTPSQYREKHKKILLDSKEEKNYIFNVEISEGLLEFFKYVKRNDTIEEEKDIKPISENINLNEISNKKLKKASKIINIENISSALKAETLDQLKYIQERLDFKYVYFSIFDKENIFWENSSGLFKNYELYMVISNFYSMNLIPIFNIDYTDLVGSKNSSEEVNKFYDKLEDFLKYFSDKFPENYIGQWKFELSYRNLEDHDGFNKFYYKLYKGLSSHIKAENIGILAIKEWSEDRMKNLEDTLKMGKSKSILPGFISFYAYPDKDLLPMMEKSNINIRNYYETLARDIEGIIESIGISIPDIYMTKFNTLSGKNDVEVGTFFRSALILDALLSVNNLITGYGVHLSTFYASRESKSEDVNISVLALFLYYTIKRPVFFIVEILNKLGEHILYQDKGLIITKNAEGDMVIALYNPSYVNPSYSLDLAYIEGERICRDLIIKGMEEGSYQIKKFIFDMESGGAYSRWANAGYPDMLDMDVLDYLENAVVPEVIIFDEKVRDRLSIHSKLSFNGIELYIVKKHE